MIREIIDMCDPLDVAFSMRFVCPGCPSPDNDRDEYITRYKIYVLSLRDDVDYLGELDEEVIIGTGDLLRIKDLPVSDRLIYYSIMYDRLHVIEYLWENSFYKFDMYSACIYAIQLDRLDCLKYMIKKPGALHTCEPTWPLIAAARCGSLECMKYLCEYGYPISIGALRSAAIHNNLDCLKYLCDRGYPLTHSFYTEVTKYGHNKIDEYLCGKLDIPYPKN